MLSSSDLIGQCAPEDLAQLKQWFELSLKNERHPSPLLPFRIDCGFKGTIISMLLKKQMDPSVRSAGRTASKPFDDFPIAQFIRRHIGDKISLEDIAKHFGFHPHYLIKLFNDRTGMSPMQYLQELRLEKAKELLEMTDLTVSEISERLGWTNSYFSRLFHQREGVSPSEYRKHAITAIGKDIALEAAFQNEWQIVSNLNVSSR
jgi:AraC-like DNA-binding protein